jgi:hypothetical protein
VKPPAPRWLVTLAGLAVGMVLGLSYAWLIDPVRPTNAYPALLRSDYRLEWIRVAALSYLAEGDLDYLQARLSGIESAEVHTGLSQVMESSRHIILQQGLVGRARALADTFDLPLPPALAPDVAPDSPSSSKAIVERPSALSFRIAQRSHVCSEQQAPRIEVTLLNAAGDGLPGVRAWLLWEEGADWAVTGLMPERGPGFADFDAEVDGVYSLGLGDFGMPLLSGLRILPCPEGGGGEERLGSWRIVIMERPDSGSGT